MVFAFFVTALLLNWYAKSMGLISNKLNSVGIYPNYPKDKKLTIFNAIPHSLKALSDSYLFISHLYQSRKKILAYIAHDIKTPLQKIVFTLNNNLAGKKQSIEKQVDEIQSLVNYLLDLSNLSLSKEDVALMDLTSFLEALSDEYQDAGFSVFYRPQGNSNILLSVYKLKLKRIFDNFISNALRYGTIVYITEQISKAKVNIFIEDNGCGIVAEKMNEFNDLNVGHAYDKFDYKSGLGMMIAKEIIYNVGGEVVLSKSSYGGLKVHVTLPTQNAKKALYS